jgi:hypothetical protein
MELPILELELVVMVVLTEAVALVLLCYVTLLLTELQLLGLQPQQQLLALTE